MVPKATVPLTRATLGEFMHAAMFGIELCAAEICAANLARWLDRCPPGLIFDLARQAYDEVRHFEMLGEIVEREGYRLGEFPVDTSLWSKYLVARNITEAIVIEQRLGEGVGLDGGARLHAEFTRWGDQLLARIFDFINADEMVHVRQGNRWLAHLLGSTEEVSALDTAMREKLDHVGFQVVHEEPINESDRELAGFTTADVGAIMAQARARNSAL